MPQYPFAIPNIVQTEVKRGAFARKWLKRPRRSLQSPPLRRQEVPSGAFTAVIVHDNDSQPNSCNNRRPQQIVVALICLPKLETTTVRVFRLVAVKG